MASAGPPRLLRPGGVPAEAIEEALGRPLVADVPADRPSAPGQLASHYAPGAVVRLNADAAQPDEILLGFGTVEGAHLNLSPAGDLLEAAANLFAMLREMDSAAKGKAIAVSPVPDHGLGRAINDRLRRAAAPRPGDDPAAR
jgi:L-threonylcarbamoyladenylate synthase